MSFYSILASLSPPPLLFGRYLPYGFNGVLGGAATLFFAYIGFDTVASTAEEVCVMLILRLQIRIMSQRIG
jgi:amino acid transporter